MSQTVTPIVARPLSAGISDRPGRFAPLVLAGYAFLILFLELALIRYVSAYVRVFGFYLNMVLIATFLGMGVGLLRARISDRLAWLFLPALPLLLIAVRFFANVVVQPRQDQNEYLWGVFFEIAPSVRRIGIVPTVILLFALCALVMIPLGALLGREFRRWPALKAYSLDIAGSLAGIAAFGLMSSLRTPPVIWFTIVYVVWLALSLRRPRYAIALGLTALPAVALVTATPPLQPEFWSPYYRINVMPRGDWATVHVNGSMHQWVVNLDKHTVSPAVGFIRSSYLRPLRLAPRLDTVLVVGAGTGNDVTNLLGMGAKYIDAVEIDPVIVDIGRAIHLQEPYADPRVHTVVNDARAFLRRTKRHYDAIIFGTLDSQTLLSGMSSVRLDNYVYTVEAFEAARDRLAPGGLLVAYHMSHEPYISSKIEGAITEAFGRPPVVYKDDPFMLFNYTFVAGEPVAALAGTSTPHEVVPVELPRDDWPYLYLRKRTIPSHYLWVLGGILLVALVLLAASTPRSTWKRPEAPMFFLGAGFLLLETKSVTEMSLLFGSTWHVNLLVFSSILLFILMANAVVDRYSPSIDRCFVGLFGSLTLAWAVPVRSLLFAGELGQWILGGLMVAVPIFFAGMIFASLLKRHSDSVRALAFNLLGAILGGVLEYLHMIVGTKALYLVAAAIYLLAFWTYRRHARLSAGTDGALATASLEAA